SPSAGWRPSSPSLHAALPILFSMDFFSHEEGQLERLAGIEARIAIGVVPVRERGLGDRRDAADAFGDVVAGHLDMHAPRIGAHLDRKSTRLHSSHVKISYAVF